MATCLKRCSSTPDRGSIFLPPVSLLCPDKYQCRPSLLFREYGDSLLSGVGLAPRLSWYFASMRVEAFVTRCMCTQATFPPLCTRLSQWIPLFRIYQPKFYVQYLFVLRACPAVLYFIILTVWLTSSTCWLVG
jgi:hypothetical protein